MTMHKKRAEIVTFRDVRPGDLLFWHDAMDQTNVASYLVIALVPAPEPGYGGEYDEGGDHLGHSYVLMTTKPPKSNTVRNSRVYNPGQTFTFWFRADAELVKSRYTVLGLE